MKNFALRKAKINVVGVVGLVENMVSGNSKTRGYCKSSVEKLLKY